MKKSLLLYSGGLDSTVLLYQRKNSTTCFSVDYGQAHVKEIDFAEWHCKKLGVDIVRIKIPKLGGLSDKDWIVQNRNMILIGHAVNYALRIGIDSVLTGCNADDAAMFPDCRKEFIDAINLATKAAGYDIDISAPLLGLTKKQIAEEAIQLSIPLHKVWTCYRGLKKPCWNCPACKKYAEAFNISCGQ